MFSTQIFNSFQHFTKVKKSRYLLCFGNRIININQDKLVSSTLTYNVKIVHFYQFFVLDVDFLYIPLLLYKSQFFQFFSFSFRVSFSCEKIQVLLIHPPTSFHQLRLNGFLAKTKSIRAQIFFDIIFKLTLFDINCNVTLIMCLSVFKCFNCLILKANQIVNLSKTAKRVFIK